MKQGGCVCWGVGKGGTVLIEKIKNLLLAKSLGIFTDNLLITENLGVLLSLQ